MNLAPPEREAGLRPAFLQTVAALTLLAAPAPFTVAAPLQQSLSGDGVKATVTIPSEALPAFGFVPVRFSVRNSGSEPVQWRTQFVQRSFGGQGPMATGESAAALAVPPGFEGDRWVFVPVAGDGLLRSGNAFVSSGDLVATVTGDGVKEAELRFNAASGRPVNMIPWAVSGALETDIVRFVAERSASASMRPPAPAVSTATRTRAVAPKPGSGYSHNLTVIDTADLPNDWRAWSPFARVALLRREFDGLLPASRAALRGWVAMGGTLYLFPDTPIRASREKIGAGEIFSLPEPAGNPFTNESDLVRGRTLTATTPAVPFSGDLSLQKGALADAVPPAAGPGDWLVYFFIAFALVIGPVNLFGFAPGRWRYRLFLTVPLISLSAVAVLFGAIWLQDGLGGTGARRALVVLLAGEAQAAVFQEQLSRTGLLLRTAFPLPDDAVCAHVAAEDINRQAARPLVFRRDDGVASGDWFRARARQGQHLRRIVPTRARIEQVGRAPDGAPILQSSVGATLRDLRFYDAQGDQWSAARVEPGARVTLERHTGARGFAAVADEVGAAGSFLFRSIVSRSASSDTPGGFVALADALDLAPIPTLGSIRWKDSAVLVTGVVERAGGKASP